MSVKHAERAKTLRTRLCGAHALYKVQGQLIRHTLTRDWLKMHCKPGRPTHRPGLAGLLRTPFPHGWRRARSSRQRKARPQRIWIWIWANGGCSAATVAVRLASAGAGRCRMRERARASKSDCHIRVAALPAGYSSVAYTEGFLWIEAAW